MKRLTILIMTALLLLCLAPMPYGYYLLVRYVATVMFVGLAYKYSKRGFTVLVVTFVALAVLFQPFFKFALGRTMWNVVDVMVAVLLIALWVRDSQSESIT